MKQNSNPKRDLLEKKIKRYFMQITGGCGQDCDFYLCASNPQFERFSNEIAGIMAVQMATSKSLLFCPRLPLEPMPLTGFTLSPFGSPHPSPPASRMHSRQSSATDVSCLNRSLSKSDLDVVPESFLKTLFGNPAFSRIFGDQKKSFVQSSKHLRPSSSDVNIAKFQSISLHSFDGISTSNSEFNVADHLKDAVGEEDPILGNEKIILKKLDYGVLQSACLAHQNSKMLQQFSDSNLLLNSIDAVFSSYHCLADSFLATRPGMHPSQLDIKAATQAYNLIIDMEPIFQKHLMNAIEILLAKLYVLATRNPDVTFLRVLLLISLNPLLLETTLYEVCMKRLCGIYGKLRSKTNEILIHWFSCLEPDVFLHCLKILKNYVVSVGATSGKSDDAFVGAVKAMSVLSNANEKLPIKFPLSAFYVTEFGLRLNFKDEYRKWKKTFQTDSVTELSLFNFPFLFDPVAKTRILHIDAMVKMCSQYEDAYVNQALVLHAQRFLDDTSVIKNLEIGRKHSSNPYAVLEVQRNNLVEDVLNQVSSFLRQVMSKRSELLKPLKVKFVNGGEEGMDQGGVQKEFFQVLISELLDPAYGLFDYDSDTRFSWFNRASLEPKSQFELVGIIFGLALYNGVILRVSFPPLMYTKLLNESVSLDDFEAAFPELGKGLRQLLNWSSGDVEDVFMRTFEISYENYGKIEHIPLIPNGADIMVTNANRKEFVTAFITHFVHTSVEDQFESFKSGFLKICGGRALEMCRPSELELLLCGTAVDDAEFIKLKEGAIYDDGYSKSHTVIKFVSDLKWFWEIMDSMDLSYKKRLLEFVTASDRVPLNGLDSLVFVIQRNGPDTDRLPSALTCFGRLLLPEYSSKQKLRDKIITAIDNAKGFGLV